MRIQGVLSALRALLFAILWTILLVCVVGLLAGGPEATPPSRTQIRPGRLGGSGTIAPPDIFISAGLKGAEPPPSPLISL